MDFSYILRESVPDEKKLLTYGFEKMLSEGKNAADFKIRKNLLTEGFYAEILLTSEKFEAAVFESETGEKYGLLDVVKAHGSFVNSIREQVQHLITEIKNQCFECVDLKIKYEDFLKNSMGVFPDFPWADLPDYGVYRCKNGKWFALIMKIKFRQLGFNSDEPVWVVNLKADDKQIPEITDRKSIFPAYHMNKKYWITVLLTCITDFEKLCSLTEESQKLVEK